MAAAARIPAFDPWSIFRLPVLNAQEPLWTSSAPESSFVEKAPPGSPLSFGEIKEEHKGWKATCSTTPQPNGLALHFELVKEQSGLKMTITQEGTGPIAADDRFKLPGAIQVPLPQYLAGFPLFLEVSGAFMIKPAFSGKNELSRGQIHVN